MSKNDEWLLIAVLILTCIAWVGMMLFVILMAFEGIA